jgi:hypothetical protein
MLRRVLYYGFFVALSIAIHYAAIAPPFGPLARRAAVRPAGEVRAQPDPGAKETSGEWMGRPDRSKRGERERRRPFPEGNPRRFS